MNNDQNEVYSKVVRAGKRTYFFDIKATKGNDLYITLTESKKIFGEDFSTLHPIKSKATKKKLKNLK